MKKILIVEDEAVMRDSLRDWLCDGGYQVETAEEGEEALRTIASQDFGIVILDLRLPGKDGLEVLQQAREKNPKLKGVIITAYPSVDTAVKAMRGGAIDYLPKPLDLNQLETLIRDTLGPVQVEIKAQAVPQITTAKPALAVPAKPKKVIAPDEIPVHIKQGKAHFDTRHYKESLEEFEAVLAVAPGNIETRVWLRKAQEAMLAPKVEIATEGGAVAEAVKPKECLWVRMGMVTQRVCTNDYNCITCEFDQMMQEKMASGEAPELDAALERLKELPGSQRLCRYALKGEVSYRVCSRVFQCATCEFGQGMEDALQQKLAKLAVRREALRKKEAKAKT